MRSREGARRFFKPRTLWISVTVLLALTLVTSGIIVGLYARQTTAQEYYESAGVAAAGGAFVYEHKAEVSTNRYDIVNGIYVLNNDIEVESNEYPVIVPGTEIPKDTFIDFDGTNDVSYLLYLEVCDSFPRDAEGGLTYVRYELATDKWTETNDFAPRHGGTVYVYSQVSAGVRSPREIEPHHTGRITDVIQDNKLYVSDEFKDIADPSLNTQPFTMRFYAYLVQKD